MATLTQYANSDDWFTESKNTVFSTARSGSNQTYEYGYDFLRIAHAWESPDYRLVVSFGKFDTSSLGASASISAAVIALYGHTQWDGLGAFNLNVYKHDGSNWTSGSAYVAGASLGNGTYPKVAHILTSSLSTSAFADCTDDALPANINKTGTTYVEFAHEDLQANATPTGYMWQDGWQIYSTDYTGNVRGPKLTVTYTVATSATSMIL